MTRFPIRALTPCALFAVVLACGGRASMLTAPSPPSVLSSCPQHTFTMLSGNVHDPNGAPVPGAQISIVYSARECGLVASAITDAIGNYQVSAATGTAYQLRVTKPGFLDATGGVTIVTDPVLRDVTLQPGAVISGTISEADVGPMNGATVTVIAGPSMGVSTQADGPAFTGMYFLNVLPGDLTLRVSKPGYDTVERSFRATVNTAQDFVLHWTHGSCLQSVAPVVFSSLSHDGGSGSFSIAANSSRTWTVTPDIPWLEVTSSASQTGSGTVTFQAQPNATTAVRTGALMVRCTGGNEGQNVWISQYGDCHITLTPASTNLSTYPPEGGLWYVNTEPQGMCYWTAYSTVDWIGMVAPSAVPRNGPWNVGFQVLPNKTGAPRTGVVVSADTAYSITQE